MKWTSSSVPLALAVALVVPAHALADGGPVAPVQGSAIRAAGSRYSYSASQAGRATIVRKGGGGGASTLLIGGRYGVPGVDNNGSLTGLSADGRTLVLAELPALVPPTTTRLLVLDTAPYLAVRAKLALPGWSTVDAISPDGRWLYLIHYPSADISRYEVRAYDLLAHRLVPKAVVDPRDRGEAMTGFPITRVMSADQRWAYTLYSRPSGSPFVHALDTAGRRAVCVDLPASLDAAIGDARMTVDRDGGRLRIAADGLTRAVIDTRTFAVSARVARSPSRVVQSAPRERVAPRSSSSFPWTLLALTIATLATLGLVAGRLGRIASRRP